MNIFCLRFCLTYFLCLILSSGLGQVGPQGQDGRYVLWQAVSLDQKISTQWTSTTIFGYSRRSDFSAGHPEESARFFGLWCIRQEWSRPVGSRYKLSVGSFYSQIGTGGQKNAPNYLHEIRIYPRFYYFLPLGRNKLSFQARNDFRIFFTGGRVSEAWSYEIRQRFCLQYNIELGKERNTLLFLPAIETFAGSKMTSAQWSPYRITETRIRFFFRFKLHPKLFLDVGDMIQLRYPLSSENNKAWSDYLALGLLISNPFLKRKEAAESLAPSPVPEH